MKDFLIYEVRYNLKACPDDGPQYPVLHGMSFRFVENARKHAREHKGSTIHRRWASAYGLTLGDFKSEAHPAATRGAGGKMARAMRRLQAGGRWTRRRRPRGPSPSSGGLFMRPPGSGAIDYQGRLLKAHELPSIVSGSAV